MAVVCEEMIADGMICEKQDCPWRGHLHVHFSPENFDMMVGEKYSPEIIENVVDHRVDPDYMAEYFPCEGECSRNDSHLHLYHVDPLDQNTPIGPKTFAILDRCTNERCAWSIYEHIHLPKN